MSNIQQETRSVRDMLIAAKVISKDSRAQESTCLTCRIPVWVSFFFDGTGNNAENDKPTQSQSNVVALFEAHKSDPDNGIHKFYYEGLGTAFEFKEFSKVRGSNAPTANMGTLDPTDPNNRVFGHKEENVWHNTVFGRGFANGIQQRLQKALFNLVKYLDDVYKDKGLTEVNICAYGFSRGATTARIFMNWVEQAPNFTCDGYGAGKRLFYRGKPVYLKILGIFDTVESIGYAADNKNPKAYKTSIEDIVEHTVHLTASLEMRKSFPLTPTGKVLHSNDVKGIMKHEQRVYPGAHSNVGGGYRPMEQMRNLGLSRITLHTMYNRLRALGGKFHTLDYIAKNSPETYKKFFVFDNKWRQDFDRFMAHAPASGNLGTDLKNQLDLYHRWIRNAGYSRFILKQLEGKTKHTEKSELNKLNYETFSDIKIMLNEFLPAGSRPLDVFYGRSNKEDLPPEVVHWFENYVCDSIGGFVGYAWHHVNSQLQDTKQPNYLIPRGIETPT